MQKVGMGHKVLFLIGKALRWSTIRNLLSRPSSWNWQWPAAQANVLWRGRTRSMASIHSSLHRTSFQFITLIYSLIIRSFFAVGGIGNWVTFSIRMRLFRSMHPFPWLVVLCQALSSCLQSWARPCKVAPDAMPRLDSPITTAAKGRT